MKPAPYRGVWGFFLQVKFATSLHASLAGDKGVEHDVNKRTRRSSLNLCQGLQLKKNLVKELIKHEQIDVLCMQETQINFNIDHNLLSFPG